jgi:trehalose/maltose transport system substrate-binding protein
MKLFPPTLTKRVGRVFGFALLTTLLIPSVGAGVTVRFSGEPSGEGGRHSKALAEQWAQKTGNKVEYFFRPSDATATLQLYQQYWAAKTPDVDVYQIDVIWQGIAAPHAVDLKRYFKEDEIKAYFPRIIENNTVGGKLVSLPLYTDAGILYYRTDLLEKYGYKEPPKTWEELAAMAKKIQDGERAAGNPDFQGFVFEGKAGESVTCNALDSWIGSMSPVGVTTYGEEEARNIWQTGNAAFMRNWPYAYALGADPKSAVSGKFAVTVLPKGGDNGKNAACLGGWQLMVSAYSKVPDAAADLVRYLSSAELQKEIAIRFSVLPTRPALYSDPDVLAKNPFFKIMPDVFNHAVARPSTVAGADYNRLSTAIFQNANNVLTGAESGKDAVVQIEGVAKRIVH